ncbi:FAD-linked oxidase-like protein, partial [Mycena crocata]
AVLLAATMCGAVGGYSIALSTAVAQPTTSKLEYGTPKDFEQAIKELKSIFPPAGLSTDKGDLTIHGESPYHQHDGVKHSVIVYPQHTEDIVKVVKINKFKMPVVPYSGATSLEGQVGGVLSGRWYLRRHIKPLMRHSEADTDLVCRPSVGWTTINETLRSKGIPLFFPIDPGPSATIGGMISTGCSGTNTVRYGTAKGEWFLNMTVVLPSGEVIKTRCRSRKSSAGFNLTKLFIGAEGTLGIITKVTLQLAPVLPTTVTTVQFPNVAAAAEAMLQASLPVSIKCVELVDDNFMAALNKFGSSKRKYLEKDGLFFKFQGHSEAVMKEVAEIVKAVREKNGGTGFKLASGPGEAEAMWSDRKNTLNIRLSLVPGAKGYSTDVCVPVSRLPELVYETKRDIAAAGIPSILVGHAGDGNFHALSLYTTKKELEVAGKIADRLVARALGLDGTCTGEHGVGIGKKYLVEELGPGTVELMKKIKWATDPLGLFNPGKVNSNFFFLIVCSLFALALSRLI